MCLFLVKGKLYVDGGLPSDTSAFSFPATILFLEVPKHQNSSKQEKTIEGHEVLVKIMEKVIRALGRMKGRKTFGSHL